MAVVISNKTSRSADTLLTEKAFAATINGHQLRKNHDPLNDTRNIVIWQERYKKTVEQIALIYFPEAQADDDKATALKWVKDRIALTKLAPEAVAALQDGRMKITTAFILARLPHDQQRHLVKHASVVKGQPRIKVSNVLAVVERNRIKTAAATTKKKPKVAVLRPKKAAPARKATDRVLVAAEALAGALDVWFKTGTSKSRKAVVDAHKRYRALSPAITRTHRKAA